VTPALFSVEPLELLAMEPAFNFSRLPLARFRRRLLTWRSSFDRFQRLLSPGPGARRRRARRGPRQAARPHVTQDYYDGLPAVVRGHLLCRVVDRLIPVTQKHDIEGLVMGVA